jgi:hypothetical protein
VSEEGAILSVIAVSQSGTQPALQPPADLRDVVCQLVHDLRQPLGGIESLAYVLELALEESDEDLRQQCGRLRQLVVQASWMLEDASLAASPQVTEGSAVDLNWVVEETGERLARQEERSLQLTLSAEAVRVSGTAIGVRHWLAHALSFFRDLAQGEPMPSVETGRDEEWGWLRVRSRVGSEESLRALDPPGGAGGLRRMAEVSGGRYECTAGGGLVEVRLWLPIADDAFNEVRIGGI